MEVVNEKGTIVETITLKRYANGELEVNGRPSRRDGKFICHLAEVGEEFLRTSQGTERRWKKTRATKAIEASAARPGDYAVGAS